MQYNAIKCLLINHWFCTSHSRDAQIDLDDWRIKYWRNTAFSLMEVCRPWGDLGYSSRQSADRWQPYGFIRGYTYTVIDHIVYRLHVRTVSLTNLSPLNSTMYVHLQYRLTHGRTFAIALLIVILTSFNLEERTRVIFRWFVTLIVTGDCNSYNFYKHNFYYPWNIKKIIENGDSCLTFACSYCKTWTFL